MSRSIMKFATVLPIPDSLPSGQHDPALGPPQDERQDGSSVPSVSPRLAQEAEPPLVGVTARPATQPGSTTPGDKTRRSPGSAASRLANT
jgi:hypothetical protein